MQTSWEPELAQLLNDLLGVQGELLAMLSRKRELLVAADTAGLAAIAPQEQQLLGTLQECCRRREQLLARAGQDGLPAESLQKLSKALPEPQQQRLDGSFHTAEARARLLRHHSLTNWVLVQRTLIHLSQMLEIIATGGRLQPTYGARGPARAAGSLVDRAA
jgi:flagellar biosynthesis/type III secretory pathway chaperone